MVKKKKHILAFEEEVEYDLIGICSHHSDYRLAWNVNETLDLKLTKIESYQVFNKAGSNVTEHSTYEFIDEENRLTYFMIKNKHEGQFLIPEKPAIDYFLFLCDNCTIELNELLIKLKSASSILGVYQFFPEEISSAKSIVLT